MKNKIIVPAMMTVWCIGILFIVTGMISMSEISGIAPEYSGHIDEIMMNFIYKVSIYLIIGSILLYLVLSHVAKNIVEPIELLTRQAKEASKGIYRHTVRNYEIDEVQQLANAFDYMGERVHRTIRKLNYQKSKAKTVLSHLDQGILVLDHDGYISEINEVGRNLIGFQHEKYFNIHAAHIRREKMWEQIIENIITKRQSEAAQMPIGDKLLYITGRAITRDSKEMGFVISIKDITDIKRLEELRYQFVSNVTHELKTPLTSIQGFVETLQDGALEQPEMATRFINIIDIEAKRLYRLIQDILLLSEIENLTHVYGEDVEIVPIVEEVLASQQVSADKKNIQLLYEKCEPFIIENSEKEQIKQIVVNIVSNAIRYTDEGEVKISTYIEEGKQIIKVQDSGIGIPEENIDRIFERFYRVDKSRSRQSGGTGLGLSIVKHIVKLYNGEIIVESEVGKGTTFIVKL